MKRLLCLLSFGALISHPVWAQPAGQLTVSDLQTICAGTGDEAVSACKFYILGATEGAATFGEGKWHFCLPPGVPSTTMVAMIKRQMERDLASFPQDASQPAVSFVAATMMNAYPCQFGN